MEEDKNVNNIKRHQEKALLWRMVSYNYNTIDLIIIALFKYKKVLINTKILIGAF